MTKEDLIKGETLYEINQRLIPVNQLDWSADNVKFWNQLVQECIDSKFNTIIRTLKGSLSYSKTIAPAYDVRYTNSLVELTVVDINSVYRVQIRTVNKIETTNTDLSGFKSFQKFKDICKHHNIDLNSYIIMNGIEEKKNIEKYMICAGKNTKMGKTYINAHHLDFHSSFPSGLVNTHPEFRPVIEELYNGRKTNPEYKYILNSTIGYMQSIPCCGAKWAHLSKDAINDNNKRIRELAQKLEDSGREVLAFNTDGIWYTGDVYHGEGEGKLICEWENDHTNCIIRFKSAGSYEFLDELGIYTPVVRGRTRLDQIKNRKEWTWGDIFNKDANPIKFAVLENGLITMED